MRQDRAKRISELPGVDKYVPFERADAPKTRVTDPFRLERFAAESPDPSVRLVRARTDAHTPAGATGRTVESPSVRRLFLFVGVPIEISPSEAETVRYLG